MTIWKHKKRGTNYKLLGEGRIRSMQPRVFADMAAVIVFKDKLTNQYRVFAPHETHRGDRIGVARVQSDIPLAYFDKIVVYRCLHDNSLWVRRHEEFYDGRFERIETAKTAE